MTRLTSCIPRWPLLTIAFCLLLLSHLAPRNWYVRYIVATRSSHNEADSEGTSTPDSTSPSAVPAPALNQPLATTSRMPTEPISATSKHLKSTPDSHQAARKSSETVRITPGLKQLIKDNQLADAKQEMANRLTTLEEYATPVCPVAVLPPVAERILFDPSIAESPPVPAPYQSPMGNKATGAVDPEKLDQENHDRIVAEARRDLMRRADVPKPTNTWPSPTYLIDSLKALHDDKTAGRWADLLVQEFEGLSRIDSITSPEVGPVLEKLKQLSVLPPNLDAEVTVPETRTAVMRIAYAISRRLMVWKEVYALATQPKRSNPAPVVDPKGLQKLLKLAEMRLQEIGNSPAWRDYLLLNEAQNVMVSRTGNVDAAAVRTLARRMLARMDAPSLNDRQFDFFRGAPFPQLEAELRQWANEPVDYRNLLFDLERYEITLNTSAAQKPAEYYQILRWSPDPQICKLADHLNTHYRNANVRVAISSEIINTLLPEPTSTQEDVNEEILGVQVVGRSTASTRLGVVLFPDRNRWRLGLFANGEAISDTESSKSGARFRNEGFANFQARKMVHVDRRGVRVGHAEAEANVSSNLSDFDTDYDGIPILNRIARSIAEKQYYEQHPQAQAEMQRTVESKASSRFDREVQSRLTLAEKNFQQKLLRPLQELGLQPTAVDMETTESRLIVRERLAGKDQLGAHTPRPQAPGSSWLSVQTHESAINNGLAHMGFDGKRSDLKSLYREIADRMGRHNQPIPDDLPDDVTIQFADEDSIRVRCENGRITLTIRIAELSQGRTNLWRNFVSARHFKPMADQSVGNLARDGVIELVGERLGFGDQIKLRGVFSKILARNTQINFINQKLSENPRLSHLKVHQFVIEDGWIGVAIEPGARTVQAPAKVKK